MVQQRYVLLDRDGVINYDSDDYIKSPEEWQPIPGSLEAIVRLNEQGYKIAVITNQSGLGRGLFDVTTLNEIHARMRRLLAEQGGEIADIYYCPHTPEEHCECRKPQPGLLLRFSQETQIPLKDIFFVGDSWKDIQTGCAVGAQSLLVKTGKGLKTLADHPESNVPVFEDLYAAAYYIIETQKP